MMTGKKIFLTYEGRDLTIFNQSSRLWTHDYGYIDRSSENLCGAGCGIFSVCHCGQWLTGQEFNPDTLADFSMDHGGRGDDGTDRPTLLAAMQETGLAKEFGFEYHGDGLRNDLETLRDHLLNHKGVILCNLRVGHIVSLVKARKVGDEVQALVIDSSRDCINDRVMNHVREVIKDSAIRTPLRNENDLVVGERLHHAMYWVNTDIIRDFNLLHAVK